MRDNASGKLLITVVYLLAFAGMWLSRTQDQPSTVLMLAAAIILNAGGGGVWFLARLALGESHSTEAKAHKLVTSGVYSKVRHPIYVGLQLVYWGFCLWFGSYLGLALSFMLVLPMSVWRAREEERVLERAFGKDYATYKARTWL